jgi:glycosyltransferase involved in cell wall biosynthesis
MPRILLVLPNLAHSGAVAQAALLIEKLPPDRFDVRICALGNEGPAVERLCAAGVKPQPLGRAHAFNVPAYCRWRSLLREFQPDVIHTWGAGPLRLAALAPGGKPRRLVASAPIQASERRRDPGRLDRWLLRRADVLVARGILEADFFFRLALGDKVVVVSPGVAEEPETGIEGDKEPFAVFLPPFFAAREAAVRVIACAGAFAPLKGFRDAIWAFDILRFIYDDLRLVLIGSGPDQQRLQRFAAAMGFPEHIHFLGSQANVPALLAESDIVWVPSLADTGTNVALEAMAAGRPVVASRQGGLAEIVRHGETGFLVAPGNKAELARQTRLLLDDPDQSRRMGEAGRRRARDRFSAAALAARYAEIYDGRDRRPAMATPSPPSESAVREGEKVPDAKPQAAGRGLK